MKVMIMKGLPTTDQYQKLRKAVSWDNVDEEATSRGLSNSLFGVYAVCNQRMVGCGRVVGDDGIYFYIQDIIVLPEYQGMGIGRAIMDAIMVLLRRRVTTNAFIGLMAAKEVEEFYEKYGFARRAENRPGMFRVWE
jgi:ribosomal protein S18 acetylase RimI-like enzyme